jgi:hypothetical protein
MILLALAVPACAGSSPDEEGDTPAASNEAVSKVPLSATVSEYNDGDISNHLPPYASSHWHVVADVVGSGWVCLRLEQGWTKFGQQHPYWTWQDTTAHCGWGHAHVDARWHNGYVPTDASSIARVYMWSAPDQHSRATSQAWSGVWEEIVHGAMSPWSS